MKKRVSKSQSKRQLKKKALKTRRKLYKKAKPGINVQKKSPAKSKGPVFSMLLASLAFVNLFSFSGVPISQAIYEENGSAVKSPASIEASSVDSSVINLPEKMISPEEEEKIKKIEALRKDVISIIKNTPMEKMADDISKKDRAVAAFLVGIAMKESKFGKFSPKNAKGRDCYNYWGYRGKENTTKSGYSCFESPSHAIEVVGGKIDSIVKRGVKTPAAMISWKCGSTCAGHDPESVKKWISDVAINYYRLNPRKEIAEKK